MFPTRHGRTLIKICGISTHRTAQAAVEAGADAIGFVHVPSSPRFIDHDAAVTIARSLPAHVTPVALFQLRDAAEIERVKQWPFEWVQLHGDEDEQLVNHVAQHKRVIRGFRFSPAEVRRWDRCDGVEVLLVDGSSGGEGKMFDHGQLSELMRELAKPVILAGGLTHENVAEAIRAVQPHGVDVSSGVETAPGKKDEALIGQFCSAVQPR